MARQSDQQPDRNLPEAADANASGPGHSFPVVGIGASAGGLEAFTQFLKALPPDTGMGFVLVQHLDPDHESALTQILARTTTIPVSEIVDNQPVQPNHIHVIPRDTEVIIERGILKLTPRRRGRTLHRPINTFFESLAQDRRERAIGVVLSGTASDGTLGLEAIKAEGGITFAQDDTAKHDSMPRSAIASGSVDLVLSPAGIAEEVARIASHPLVTAPPLPSGDPPEAQQESRSRSGKKRSWKQGRDEAEANETAEGTDEDGYKKILLLLRSHSGVDFALYKSTTIRRRILRRLLLTKHAKLGDYATFLKGNAKELDALYSDVLISVTSFFRNPEAFDSLQANVLSSLLSQRTDDPVRCWVLGCSTGQEAYSLAMAFVEVAENAPNMRQLQVFATDLNEALLEKARHGLYAKSLAEDISPQRLRRFFHEEQGGYRINKSLREMVVFARQNLIADPPFSRMDLISCRNLLIYLEPTLQKRAISTFHYALRPGGFLLLGASESIGGFTELFEPVDKKSKIYVKKAAATSALHLSLSRSHAPDHVAGKMRPPLSLPKVGAGREDSPDGLRGELNAQREADRVALSQFAPPGVLINAENQVLQFRGATGAYLEPPAGKASFDVLKMAREGLMLPLRTAIEEAKKENKTARREGVRVQRGEGGETDGETRTINLEVIPLKNAPERCFLVVFLEPDRAQNALRQQLSRPHLSKAEEASRVAELEADLSENRDYLQAMQEQHDATNEELQASNEEVQSANEELQSVNEELETSKEELESSNEELTTVNEEMSHRNAELIRLNNDLVNLQTSTKLAILLVGRDLRVTRFSPHAEKQFDLLATDMGRPIGHIRHQLVLASDGTPLDLESLTAEVIASVHEQEREVRDRSGRWYSLRTRPYMTLDNRVDGAVLVLVDIDDLKKVERVVADARDYAENTIATVREPMLVLDKDLRVESANLAFYRTFGVVPEETNGKFLYALGDGQWDIPGLRALLETTLVQHATIEDFVVEHEFPGIGRKVMLLNARRMHDPQRKTLRILLAIEDITKRQKAEADTAHLAAIVASSDDAIVSKDLNGIITSWNRGAERLFEYSAEEIVGQPVLVLIPEDRAAEEPKILERIRRGESVEHYETVRRRKDGSLIDVSVTVSPLRDTAGRVIGASKIARNIAERVAMEKRIKEQAEALAGESRRKDEFLAMLSHELRNPLAPIRSAVHLMRMQERGSENLIQQQAREIIERQVANLTKIVSDLLEVSRVVSGRIRLERQTVDLNRIIQHAIETAKPLIEQRKHTFKLNVCNESNGVWVNVDPTRIEEVFINLLNNAAKYTPDGGRIELWCENSPASSYAQVRVRDNGLGIDKELLPRIFDLFTQADRSLARSAGGLGIGLSLAHRLVDLHGGTIEAHSPPEGETQGSEFIVRLPLMDAPPKGTQAHPPAEEALNSGGTRVLLVDDNIDLVMMLASTLRQRGYNVQAAYTGPEGLKTAQQWRPDVVLLDIGLPGMDGYEVAKRLRTDRSLGNAGAQMKLIALTGYGRDSDIAAAREAGFDGHLIKPVEFKKLESVMAMPSSPPQT